MKVLVAGDFCPQDRVAALLKSSDADSVFEEIKDILSTVDYSIVNLECPIADNEDKPILKCGPNLKCSSEAISVLNRAGFCAVTLANNHFRDYGDTAINKTLDACKKNGIKTVGGEILKKEMLPYTTLHLMGGWQ